MLEKRDIDERIERRVQELLGAVEDGSAQKLCNSCGFLALRDAATAEPVEALAGFRERGSTRTSNRSRYPLCVKHRRDFAQARRYQFEMFSNDPAYLAQIQQKFGEGATSEDALEALAMRVVIGSPFKCDEWAQYIPGTGPKEMLAFEREQRRDREMREREDRRDRETREREDDRDRQTAEFQRSLHTREMWIMGGVVTVAIVAGSIIAAILEGAISRGWEPGWWPW